MRSNSLKISEDLTLNGNGCECDNGCEYGKRLTGIRYELKKIWYHFTQEMLWKPLRDLYVIFWNISGCYEETGPELSFFKS